MRRDTQRWANAPVWLSVLVGLGALWIPATVAGARDSHPAGVPEVCPEILRGKPTGDLKKETEPSDDSKVRPGDEIKVKLTWDRDDFSGDSLHKVVDCVTVDGELDTGLSTMEKPTENDGEFHTTFKVPDDAEEGTEICDRGFASGAGDHKEDFERHKSNDVCFEVAKREEEDHGKNEDHGKDEDKDHGDHDQDHGDHDNDSNKDHDNDQDHERKPDTEEKASPPPVVEQVTTTTTAVVVPPPAPVERLRPVLPETVTRPAPPVPVLARTGPAVRLFVLSAGLAFVLGGAAFMVPVRRRRAGT